METWYKIDNAGKIFHAVKKATNSSVFRVSISLYEKVNHKRLQEAADIVSKRFPTLAVSAHEGLFWEFLEGNKKRLIIEKETDSPCSTIDPTVNNDYLMRVIYYNQRISVEVFHSLTDGTGVIEFLKTLVYQYLLLIGKKVEADGIVLLPMESPTSYETEDSYEKHYKKVHRKREKESKAFHIKGTAFEPPGNNVVQGVLNSTALKTAAKENNATITEFLTAIMMKAIYAEAVRYGSQELPVKIAIPVNLRKLFPSKTLRNFFTVVNVGMSLTEESSFEMVLQEVSSQLKKNTNKQYLSGKVYENMKLQRMMSARFMPVAIKYIAMRRGFKQLGENLKTMTLSNLGHVQLPPSLGTHVERMECVMYPTDNSPINCGVCSVNDQVTISFSRSIIETDIIKNFFRYLSIEAGLEVKVSSNNWGWNSASM